MSKTATTDSEDVFSRRERYQTPYFSKKEIRKELRRIRSKNVVTEEERTEIKKSFYGEDNTIELVDKNSDRIAKVVLTVIVVSLVSALIYGFLNLNK